MLAEGKETIVLECQGRKVPQIIQCVFVHRSGVCLSAGGAGGTG